MLKLTKLPQNQETKITLQLRIEQTHTPMCTELSSQHTLCTSTIENNYASELSKNFFEVT